MILLHGTTRRRAESILVHGPDPRYREPGGAATDDGFTTNLASGPFLFGTPEQYARGKDAEFPTEGGAVILELDVPEDIVAKAVTDWLPLSQGLIQFDIGRGFEELMAVWGEVARTAHIRELT